MYLLDSFVDSDVSGLQFPESERLFSNCRQLASGISQLRLRAHQMPLVDFDSELLDCSANAAQEALSSIERLQCLGPGNAYADLLRSACYFVDDIRDVPQAGELSVPRMRNLCNLWTTAFPEQLGLLGELLQYERTPNSFQVYLLTARDSLAGPAYLFESKRLAASLVDGASDSRTLLLFYLVKAAYSQGSEMCRICGECLDPTDPQISEKVNALRHLWLERVIDLVQEFELWRLDEKNQFGSFHKALQMAIEMTESHNVAQLFELGNYPIFQKHRPVFDSIRQTPYLMQRMREQLQLLNLRLHEVDQQLACFSHTARE